MNIICDGLAQQFYDVHLRVGDFVMIKSDCPGVEFNTTLVILDISSDVTFVTYYSTEISRIEKVRLYNSTPSGISRRGEPGTFTVESVAVDDDYVLVFRRT